MSRFEDRHKIASIAEIMIRCACGWKYRPAKIRGVPKTEIDMDLMAEYEDHLAKMKPK